MKTAITIITWILLTTQFVEANTNVVISSQNGAVISWDDTNSNGTYSVEWSSSLSDDWTDSWSSVVGIKSTGGMISASVPLFFRVVHHPARTNGALFEDFEDSSGWSNHVEGSWSHTANSGTWTSYNTAASTSALFSRSGTRYIWMNSFDQLVFPAVDNPTQVIVWVRGPSSSSTYTIGLQFFDGNTWQGLEGYWGGGNTYTSMIWNLDIGYPNPGQLLRIEGSWDKYIDDIEIRVAP